MSVRAFPMPTFPAPRPASWCRWCGVGPILKTRGPKAGEPDLQRSWHNGRNGDPECFYEYQLHTSRDVQFAFVEDRDGLKCWDCGAAPEKWVRGYVCSQAVHNEPGNWESGTAYVARFTDVRRATALELEHDRPLWLTTHLSADERRPFFGPDNLRLRCQICHAAKTAKEAADRAKGNRLIATEAGTTKPKRKIAGRGFDKTKTRGFDGKVRAR